MVASFFCICNKKLKLYFNAIMVKLVKIDFGKKELWEQVLEYVTNGNSVHKACEKMGTKDKYFFEFLKKNPDKEDDYIQAREARGDRCIDKIEELEQKLLNKEIDPMTARILIDTEKWKACKFYPKMYGEKQQVELKATKSFAEFVKEINEED